MKETDKKSFAKIQSLFGFPTTDDKFKPSLNGLIH